MRVFVASTGQNVGKTTTCLGLFSGLKKRFPEVGFMKPVGQEWVEAETGLKVDKDTFHFKKHPNRGMSPVLLPSGFTRDFLDGKIDIAKLEEAIDEASAELFERFPISLIEGTGHMGVGSLIGLNNAVVAARLNSPMLIIAPGGVGASFDKIALNKALCDQHGVKIAGVILNKVVPQKLQMVQGYMQKALARWDIPLLGCIPFDSLLNTPTLNDFEKLFQTELISGEALRLFHFRRQRMISSSVESFAATLDSDQLIITHADREDIIGCILAKKKEKPDSWKVALILTTEEPKKEIRQQIVEADIPCLLASTTSFHAMQQITAHTAKIAQNDEEKIAEAIQIVERAIDFDALLQKLSN